LAKTARQHVPPGLTVQGGHSIYLDRSIISLNCVGRTTREAIASAQAQFYEETGWQLELKGVIVTSNVVNAENVNQALSALSAISETSSQIPEAAATSIDAAQTRKEANPFPAEPLSQHEAIQLAQRMLSALPGYYKAGGEVATSTLLLRFHFPLVAQTRYADVFAELEARTGWHVRLHQTTHQQALIELARRMLPSGLACDGVPSLYVDQR